MTRRSQLFALYVLPQPPVFHVYYRSTMQLFHHPFNFGQYSSNELECYVLLCKYFTWAKYVAKSSWNFIGNVLFTFIKLLFIILTHNTESIYNERFIGLLCCNIATQMEYLGIRKFGSQYSILVTIFPNANNINRSVCFILECKGDIIHKNMPENTVYLLSCWKQYTHIYVY